MGDNACDVLDTDKLGEKMQAWVEDCCGWVSPAEDGDETEADCLETAGTFADDMDDTYSCTPESSLMAIAGGKAGTFFAFACFGASFGAVLIAFYVKTRSKSGQVPLLA